MIKLAAVAMTLAVSIILYFLGVEYSDRFYGLGIRHKGWLIVSRFFYIVMAVEAAGVVIYTVYRFEYDIGGKFFLSVIISIFMAVLANTDYRKNLIPNRILVVATAVWFVICGLSIIMEKERGIELTGNSLAGAMFSGGAFLLCYIITKKKMGAGDVKMAAVMGLFLGGRYIFFSLIVGVMACVIYSFVQIFRKKMSFKDGVPLAPFLFFGTVAALLL